MNLILRKFRLPIRDARFLVLTLLPKVSLVKPPSSRNYFHQSNPSFKSQMSVCSVPIHHPHFCLTTKLETKYCKCVVDSPPDEGLIHQESSSMLLISISSPDYQVSSFESELSHASFGQHLDSRYLLSFILQ
ncbi:MAG: hypothetical protein EZS28_035771 [Streblomastix strix]|uniref:Uncharacterized protein n=1 Tax=Streblomastix strix TaxID=222440 RepID=A0A5J4UFU0_9EUKA|nr:MAG: hypothetical protein EZS28_035771 [Streblomastix strix]